MVRDYCYKALICIVCLRCTKCWLFEGLTVNALLIFAESVYQIYLVAFVSFPPLYDMFAVSSISSPYNHMKSIKNIDSAL